MSLCMPLIFLCTLRVHAIAHTIQTIAFKNAGVPSNNTAGALPLNMTMCRCMYELKDSVHLLSAQNQWH